VESFVVVMSSDDRLADRATIDIAQLAGREWVLFDHDHGLSEVTVWAS
jgi:hypothetical protein